MNITTIHAIPISSLHVHGRVDVTEEGVLLLPGALDDLLHLVRDFLLTGQQLLHDRIAKGIQFGRKLLFSLRVDHGRNELHHSNGRALELVTQALGEGVYPG
jgi:hypothetical protein